LNSAHNGFNKAVLGMNAISFPLLEPGVAPVSL
jgi:hypothetical protein